MASAQAMEEELQQSVLAAQDTEWGGDATHANEASYTTNKGIRVDGNQGSRGSAEDDEADADSDRDASGEEVEEDAEADEDAEGEEDFGVLNQGAETGNVDQETPEDYDEDVEDEDDEDAEGEEDEELAAAGAVKIRAPEDSDEEMNDESDVSEPPSAVDEDSEEENAWEDARDTAEDEGEDSEAAPSNICMFCKQDEENDPSEDFEAFLACKGCGENAHQQCARDAAAISEQNDAKHWMCPECHDAESEEHGEHQASIESDGRPISRHSDVPRDLLAAKTGSENGDSHSIFNELVLEDDPMNGSRLLRKRKTSSIEPDESIVALRKRRRNPSAESNHEELTDGANSGEPGTAPRSARTLRLKVTRPPPVSVEKRSRTSLLMKLQVRPGNLKEILSRKKRDRRRTGGGSAPRPSRPAPAPPARASNTPVPMIETPFTAESYSQPFYSFFDRDTDDAKGKPYGGILSEAEADTSKTLPATDDRHRFDQAKQKADEEWRARVLAMQAEAELPIRKPKKANDHASQIECIEFGGWEIDTWYAAPYPAEYSRNRVLYICEFCLKYMNSDYVAWRHKLKCATKHPPGDEIYRKGSISFFEVDGRKNPVYCQNLCLLAKLFLGSKTLYYDVEPFLFYVLCEYDECGYHFVGYFSKEKRSSSQNNVSCILTLPIHQRKGYGNLLIDFSYLLTKVEEKTGSPEKPLSDLGLVSYRSYWRLILCRYLLDITEKGDHRLEGLSIKQISDDTAMTPDDVIAALEGLRALVRDPQTKLYAFRVDLEFCRQYVANWESKGHVKLKPEALAWTPYIMGRGNAANFELGPISAMAPREEDEAQVDEGSLNGGTEPLAEVNGMKDSATSEKANSTTEGKESSTDVKAGMSSFSEKGAEEDKENTMPQEGSGTDMDGSGSKSWSEAYRDIPPSRFDIFPPITGSRRNDRARQSVPRPAVLRTSSSAARPRPKRPSGSARKSSSSSRPKSSSSRRKTGGTGRGPGRWPKGTKKSDYGNADSGPGFPPGWKPGDGDPNAPPPDGYQVPAQDEVKVFMATADTNGTSEHPVGGDIEVKASAVPEEAVEDDEEDVDAEGEDA